MAGDGQKDRGFLAHMKGFLWQTFNMTPMGIVLRAQYDPTFSQRTLTGLNEGVKDVARDAFFALSMVAGSHNANEVSDKFEQMWRKGITKNVGLGQSEFKMAVGWDIPKGMVYNGKPVGEDQKISRLDAVYIRNKGGKVEVMDANDPRYMDMVFPYLVMQLASPTAATKAFNALKGLAEGSKIAEKAMQGGDKVVSGLSIANTSLMAGFMVKHGYNQLVLKPEAINRMAHLLDNPDKMQPHTLRNELNEIFSQYSYKNGILADQIYVPRIADNEDPLKRLDDLAKGVLHGVQKSKDGFDRITDQTPRQDIQLTESRNDVRDNIYFKRGFYKLADAVLSGRELTDNETTSLRFAMNVYFGTALDMAPAKGGKFTAEEKGKTISDFRDLYAAMDYEPLAGKEVSTDAKKATQEMRSLVGTQLKATESIIRAKEGTIQHQRIDNPFTLG